MYRKKTPKIYWEHNLQTYMYGSQVSFREDGSVHFYNPLIPSGTDIQIWNLILNFQANRRQPSLPLLKRGKSYRLKAKLETVPENSVFLKIVFMNRYGEELSQVIEKSSQAEFTYPQDAYSYRVSLLSAGLREMDFHYFMIEEAGDRDD